MKAPFHDKRTWLRVAIKVLVILIVANALFIILRPFDAIVSFSIYGHIVPLRMRIIVPARNEAAQMVPLETLLQAHVISQPKDIDEFRVVVLGDSGINGWRVVDIQTVSSYLTSIATNIHGKQVRAYKL